MTTPDLITNLRDYLIEQEIVRDPRSDDDLDLPPCWREPEDGAPAPGEKNGVENSDVAVVSLFRTGGIPGAFGEQQHFSKRTVDVVIRGKKAPDTPPIEEAITIALTLPAGEPADTPAMSWEMGALTVISSQIWREWQPLDHSPQAFTVVGSFYFETYLS